MCNPTMGQNLLNQTVATLRLLLLLSLFAVAAVVLAAMDVVGGDAFGLHGLCVRSLGEGRSDASSRMRGKLLHKLYRHCPCSCCFLSLFVLVVAALAALPAVLGDGLVFPFLCVRPLTRSLAHALSR